MHETIELDEYNNYVVRLDGEFVRQLAFSSYTNVGTDK